MYTQEQLATAYQAEQAKQQPLTAESVEQARQRLDAARDQLAWAEAGNGSVYEARQVLADAASAYQHTYRLAYPLVLAKQQAEQAAAREKEQQAEQAAYAAGQEAEAKAQYKVSYLSAGGTSAQFETAWPGIWTKELEQRTVAQHDALRQHILATGKYSA